MAKSKQTVTAAVASDSVEKACGAMDLARLMSESDTFDADVDFDGLVTSFCVIARDASQAAIRLACMRSLYRQRAQIEAKLSAPEEVAALRARVAALEAERNTVRGVVRDCLNDLGSDNPVKWCAAEIGLAAISSPDYQVSADGKLFSRKDVAPPRVAEGTRRKP